MRSNLLRELYLKELKDLYNAEQQLVKALPRLAKAASSEELSRAFEDHLEQTREHASRVETILSNLGETGKGARCKGMEGLIREGAELLEKKLEPEMRDAALIAAAQRVEHYEMAGYGCVRTFAELLHDEEAASQLQQTLDEEKAADEKLTEVAQRINVEAAEVETQEKPRKRGRARAAGA